MKIGILQTGHAPDELKPLLGDYADMFQDLLHEQGFEYEVHNVVDNEFPASAVDADGWLITGSKHGAYEDHDWIPPLEDLIRAIVESGRPLIGVCFGHQIIAQALGGKVEKYKGGWAVGHQIIAQALGGKVEKYKGGWAVGRQTYDFGGVDMAFNAWHQDQVVERPEGTIVLASNDFCENAVLLYGDRVLTIQPHPEFDAPMIDGLINTRGKGVVPDDLLQTATEHLLEDVDNETFADQMADFFRRERS